MISFNIFLIILYSNMLAIGYNFFNFLLFIIKKPCFYGLLFGLFILLRAVGRMGKYVLLFRRKAKFFR